MKTQKHRYTKESVTIEPGPKKKLSELAGTLSKDTADAMLIYITESREEWDERLKSNFDKCICGC